MGILKYFGCEPNKIREEVPDDLHWTTTTYAVNPLQDQVHQIRDHLLLIQKAFPEMIDKIDSLEKRLAMLEGRALEQQEE